MEKPRYIQTIYPKKENPPLSPDDVTRDKSNLVRVGEDIATRKRGAQRVEVGEEIEKSIGLGYPTFKAIYVVRSESGEFERYVLGFKENGAIFSKTTLKKDQDGELKAESEGYIFGDRHHFSFTRENHVLKTRDENDEIYVVHSFAPGSGEFLSEDIDIAKDFEELEIVANS